MVGNVVKRDGSVEEIDRRKIRRCLERCFKGLDVDINDIVEETATQLYDGVSTHDIDRSAILACRSRIVRNPIYSYATARILLNVLYKECFGHKVDGRSLHNDYKKCFKVNLRQLVDVQRVSPDLLTKFDIDAVADALDHTRDNDFKYAGLQTVYDRYLLHINGRRMETPQAWLMRVSMGLCLNESNPTEMAIQTYEMLSTGRYLHSTPTLFNSGSMHPQLSSCYLSTLDDSIDGIFGGMHGQARLSKYAGGLGVDFSHLRGMGGYIKGTNGESNGVIPWMKVFNDTLVAVNQGGKRKGAGAAYLATWHIDIEDFLELRKATGDDRRRTHDMYTANWIPDRFMREVQQEGEWYTFSPDECPLLHQTFGEEFDKAYDEYVEMAKAGGIKTYRVLDAKSLWKKMLMMLRETGGAWMTWSDPSNSRYSNQHVGVVHNSNLCTEILLHTTPTKYENGLLVEYGMCSVCNLASVRLDTHVTDGQIDYERLAETVKHAIRMLDNVIDINFYPIEEARLSNMKNRPIGLGVMGWQDMLCKLDIDFDSEEMVELADKVQEFISYHAILSSAELARERGHYENYEGSTWSQNRFPIDTYNELMDYRGTPENAQETLDWEPVRKAVAEHGVRNSNMQAVAPTATISTIAGCSRCIEPDYKMVFVYSTLSGEMTMYNEYFAQALSERGLWNEKNAEKIKDADGDVMQMDWIPEDIKQRFKRPFDIDQHRLIDAAAARQKWIDMGQSLNLYYNGTSGKFLNDMYMHAWQKGLKTTYYLRGEAASKVEKSVVAIATEPQACSVDNPDCESCQ